MTNEERIRKLCEAVIDLIDMLNNKDLNWVRDEVMDIWEEML